MALCLATTNAEAQSPYLSVTASMDTGIISGRKYKIEMKICQPVKTTKGDDWFSPDTSTLNFSELKSEELICSEYQANGEGIEILSGNLKFDQYNSYKYSNQVFAWEKVLVFRITDETEGDTPGTSSMYMVLPVKYKSFITNITIDSIPFIKDHLLDLGSSPGAYINNRLRMRIQPDVRTAIPINNFPGASWIQ